MKMIGKRLGHTLRVFCLIVLAAVSALYIVPRVYAWFSNYKDRELNVTGNVRRTYFERGRGTADEPYVIARPLQLYYLAWLQDIGIFNQDIDNNGTIDTVYFELGNMNGQEATENMVIDMSGMTLPPIGTTEYPFVGSFNGNGRTISGLTVSNDDTALSDMPSSITPDSATTNAPILGLFGVVGGYTDTTDWSAPEKSVYDVILEDITIDNISPAGDQALAGLAAGYVNGVMENVKVEGTSTITNAPGITAMSFGNETRTALSDHALAGYCTEPYRELMKREDVKVYDPTVEISNLANYSEIGQGSAWGNTIDMHDMYNKLKSKYDSLAGQTSINYTSSKTITHNTDGTTTEVGGGTSSYPVTAGAFPVRMTAKNSGDVDSYAFIQRNNIDDFMYLYGNTLINTVPVTTTEIWKYESFYIKDHDTGNYLAVISNEAENATTAETAGKWVFEQDTATGKYAIFTIDSNTKKYLTANNGSLGISTAAFSGWEVDAGKTSISVNDHYLCWNNTDGEWKLCSPPKNYICDTAEGNYLSLERNGNTISFTNKTSVSNATEWDIEPESGGYKISTVLDGARYYLYYDQANDVFKPSADHYSVWYENTTETKNKLYVDLGNDSGKALYCNGTEWILVDYVINGEGQNFGGSIDMANIFMREQDIYHYKTTSSEGNNQYTYNVDDDGSGKYNLIYNGANSDLTHYIAHYGTGSYIPLSVNDDHTVKDNNTGYIVGGHSGSSPVGANVRVARYPLSSLSNAYNDLPKVYVRLGDGRYLKNNSGSSIFVTSKEDASQFIVNVANNNDNPTTNFYLYDGSQYLRYNGSFTSSAYSFVYTYNNCFKRYGYTNYLALNGDSLTTVSNLDDATPMYFEYVDDSFDQLKIYTRTTASNGIMELTEENMYGLGSNYQNARNNLTQFFNETPGFIYGLHFMNASISTSSTITVPRALISGNEYTQLPNNCIDFHVKDTGFISFFAGTYYYSSDTWNQAFFSLHKINRDTNGNISTIQEIKKIYKRNNTTAGTEQYVYYISGTDSYANDSTNYTLAFDTSWISNQNAITENYRKSVFYFEIPVNPGEYALGSTSADGAYLFYLDISANATIEGDSKIKSEGTAITATSSQSTGEVQISETQSRSENIETPPTYFPLAMNASGTNVLDSNTGYVVSGANLTTGTYLGDIRVSRYNSDPYISNSLTNGSLDSSKIFTIGPNGQQTLQQYGTDRFYKYHTARSQLQETLDVGEGSVYGLHFMNAEISTSHLVTLPTATINGQTYTNFAVPEDSIDFTLRTQGYINFFAGTYFSGSNVQCFFSLHQIFRDAQNEITEIKEIKEIYKNADGSYTYRYDGESAPSGGTKVFDTAWLTDPANIQRNRVYYFEIPANAGEYALGSVAGKNGAYLLYLDISTHQGDSIITREKMEITTTTYLLPAGIRFSDDEYKSYIIPIAQTGDIVIVSDNGTVTSLPELDENSTEATRLIETVTATDYTGTWVVQRITEGSTVTYYSGTDTDHLTLSTAQLGSGYFSGTEPDTVILQYYYYPEGTNTVTNTASANYTIDDDVTVSGYDVTATADSAAVTAYVTEFDDEKSYLTFQTRDDLSAGDSVMITVRSP